MRIPCQWKDVLEPVTVSRAATCRKHTELEKFALPVNLKVVHDGNLDPVTPRGADGGAGVPACVHAHAY